ncbi:hypothetical protein HHK36_002646 [Tetracentron sinense]|uniref:Protein TIC 21, chloroplastic n=1 Tax=Tetracentron sinense TaxID=13715 RepID=A0A834ZMF4_TETSI|nr:hypothetical protein HHK36_002646 [Tetracentron sinense]
MQTLLIPAARSNPAAAAAAIGSLPSSVPQRILSLNQTPALPLSLPRSPTSTSLSFLQTRLSSPSSYTAYSKSKRSATVTANASAPASPSFISSNDESEKAKLAQVSKRLESTSRYFKRLGSLGLWGQLVCTVVSAVILSFSVIITGKITSPATFYATAGGIVAAFISVFFSFGYIRLSDRLRRTASEPAKV